MLRTSFSIFVSIEYPEGGGCLAPVTNEMFATYDLAEKWVIDHGKAGVDYIVTSVVGESMPEEDVDVPERFTRRAQSRKPFVKRRPPSIPGLQRKTVRKGKVL